MPLVVGQPVSVRKLEWLTGRETISWAGTLLALDEGLIVVEAPFEVPQSPVTIDGVMLERGDRFTEFYYPRHWFNVFHIASPGGEAKGWYCNVASPPELEDGAISFVDLVLDLFVHPDGRYTVLDEEQFAATLARAARQDDARTARAALQELIELATRGALPSPSPVRRNR